MQNVEIERLKPNKHNGIMPKLSDEQFEGLKEMIRVYGISEPIEVDVDFTIIDGHNRVEACRQLGINIVPCQPLIVDDHLAYIIDKNVSRRHLTKQQEDYLRGKLYVENKKPHGGDRKANESVEELDNGDTESSGHDAHLKNSDVQSKEEEHLEIGVSTSEKLGNVHKVDEKTIRRDGEFAEAVDKIGEVQGDEVKQRILSDDLKISKKDVKAIAEEEQKEQKRIIDALDSGEAANYEEAKAVVGSGDADADAERPGENKPERNKIRRLSASEAVYGFIAWLTTRKEKTLLSSSDDAAPVAELIAEFCKANKLSEARDGWEWILVYPV